MFTKIGDRLINRKLKSQVCQPNCTLVIGQKRCGKSTLFSFIADFYFKQGYKVFSNYPIENTYMIPIIEYKSKKTGKKMRIIDKDWLYECLPDNSVVIIDEAGPIWPARKDVGSWTNRDTEFFTMLGHHNIICFLCAQYYDLIDINLKRACDETWFLTQNRYFKNVTDIDMSASITLKVADKNSEIIDSKFTKRGARCVTWTLCEIHLCDCKFYRKPYYSLFSTEFDYAIHTPVSDEDLFNWNDFFDFDNKTLKLPQAAEKGDRLDEVETIPY